MRIALGLLLALAACKSAAPKQPAVAQAPVTRTSGLVTQVLRAGEGDEAKSGDKVSVHYVGALKDGTKFDSSRDRDAPFSFWVGEKQVIEGWDEGVLGMREGELRLLTIPPGLGYGGDAKLRDSR